MAIMTSAAELDKAIGSEEEIASDDEVLKVEVAGEAEDSDNEHITGGTANIGWADSISKILRTTKPKGKRSLVLSRAKKLTDLKITRTQPAGFEVATNDGEIQQVKIEFKDVIEEQPPRKKKRDLRSFRSEPNILEKDRERTLVKIATKGVVQLFNSVKNQQMDVTKKLQDAGPLEVKKEQVLKSIDKKAFLDVLMGAKSQIVDDEHQAALSKNIKTENIDTCSGSTWSVLKDDFMMEAKLKDWDRETETVKNAEYE